MRGTLGLLEDCGLSEEVEMRVVAEHEDGLAVHHPYRYLHNRPTLPPSHRFQRPRVKEPHPVPRTRRNVLVTGRHLNLINEIRMSYLSHRIPFNVPSSVPDLRCHTFTSPSSPPESIRC